MVGLEVQNSSLAELFVVLELLEPLGLRLDFVRKLAHKRGLATLGLELQLCSVVYLRRRRRRGLGSKESSRRSALMV